MIAPTTLPADVAIPRRSFPRTASAAVRFATLLLALLLVRAAPAAGQTVSCATETSGSATNYVCTITDCTSFDLNTLNGLVGADGDSVIWIRAWGGEGGKGNGVAAADGGDGGDGGYAQTVTTVNDYYGTFGTTLIYFYLGEMGNEQHEGGLGGSSTIVAAADLTVAAPCISGCGSANIVLIAGGGGGGGQASSDGFYAGGHGGDGGSAFAPQGSAGLGTGDASAGNNQGENSAGGGGNGQAGTDAGSSGGGKSQSGIGGYGGEVHISSGGSAPQGWSNQTPTQVGTMGQGGEGGHDDAAGGGGGGGYGGGGGGGSGSSLQGTGGGGGGSYAAASTQPTSSAPTSRPSSPSSAGVLQIVYQQIARTPLPPPTSTATVPPTTTPVVTLAAGEVNGATTPTPTVAASATPTSAGTPTATPQPFADNPDILNGQRVLADVVDLIVVNPLASGQTTQMQNIVLQTANGGVESPQITSDVASAPCVQDATPFGNPFPQQTRAGRLFDTVEDVIVTLGPNAQSSTGTCSDATDMSLYVTDTLVPANGSTTAVGPVTTGNLMMAIADFNLDGFDDVFVINQLSAFTATALDTATPSAGLSVGPSVLLTSAAMSPLAEPATGDFNADGLIDVAWIGGAYDGGPTDASVYFATVCPGPVPDTVCATSASFDILLMPLSAAAIALPNPDTYCGGFAANAVTAGNFSGDVSVGIPNQLMTITINDSCLPAARIYDFDGDLTATALTAATELPGMAGASLQVSATYATTAVLNVLSTATQAVVAYGGPAVDADGDVSTVQTVAVVSYDGLSSLDVVAASTSTESLAPLAGLAVGVFGAPPETDPTTQDYTPSVAALLGAGCAGESPSVQIYTIDIDTLAPGLTSTVALSGVALPTTVGYINLAGSLLQAGDLQGESVRVGQPVLVEVTSSAQPYIVLGAPPMHADYVALDDDDPDVVNFSVLPGNYYSQYNTMVIGSNQSSTQSTTSYGHAIDVSATEQAGYAFALAFEANTTLTQSVQLTYDRTTSKQYDSFAEVDFDASTQTNFYDQVWYTMQSYTLYNYPVIGQTSCPADSTSATSCDPAYPLYVTLSGPTVDTQVTVQGSTLEWFQPVHEIGQVFSYPANETLLEARLDDPSEPLSSAVSFDTDTSSSEESVSWSISQSLDLTAGSSSTFSFATDNSVTAGTPLYSILDEGVQVSVSGDYSTTTAQSTLNSQTTMVGASGGIEIIKSGQFLNPSLYAYQVEPFIFGETEPVSPDQTIALDTDIQTTGTLQTAFAADPTTGSGAWWVGSTPYSTYPDLAFNHPARWTYDVENRTNPPSACLQQTEMADDGYLCMTANDPDPDDLWDSEFYWMRGLLITVGGATGAQRNTAVVGDDVYLQARLYNYSLTEMAAGTEIHVQFYMQQWDDLTKAAVDDAILINGTDSVLGGGIPAFNETTQNWTTVTTSFSTSELPGDTLWIFWVVAWMEDSDGNLVDELPGHGLTEIPGTLTSIADVPIETVTVTLPDGSKDSDASFTNNVGFYNVEFALQSADTAAALNIEAQGVAAPPEPDDLDASLSKSRAETGEKITVSGLIHSPAGLPDGAFVYFYDGVPISGAQPFDIELIPPVRPGDSGLARVPYRARTCGLHPITIVASRGRANEVSAAAMLDVPCDDATPTATPVATPTGPTATATPRATPAAHEDDGCAIVPSSRPGAVALLFPALAALAWRRRRRG